ncbi:MAG: protein translocase subunit SecD [Gaiellaceae bacterium]|jgi:SecD/SecF fusion protein
MSSRRAHITLLLLIAATLAGVFLVASPGSPLYKAPKLGLDLKGGLQVVLKAKPFGNRLVTSTDMSHSVNIMRNRVDALGVSEPDIRTQGHNEIVIDLPGVTDTARAMSVIKANAVLMLFDLERRLVNGVSALSFVPQPRKLYPLLELVNAQLKKGVDTQYAGGGYYLFSKNHNLVVGPVATLAELKSALLTKGRPRLKSDELLGVPSSMTLVSCSAPTTTYCPGPGKNGGFPPQKGQKWYYLFNLPPNLTGKDLNAGGIRADYQSGGPIVDLSFTNHGNQVFHDITRTEWNYGQQLGPQHFAVVLDGQLITAPEISPTDKSLSDGIDPAATGAIIEGIGSIKEAQNIATVLQTGALPVRFVPLASTQISATLGKDSLRQAMIAAIVGLALVVVFLLALYRFLGLVAVIGLGIYAIFLYGVILFFNVTLSLPGFAGMILTIGVAADANVVIFERIKEESRAGKSVKAAVATGYARGFHTILDANVVTFITAAVLFLVATAGVKGFALMLMLGTGISLVTAVAGTRAMLGLLSNFRWFNNPSFMGAHGAQRGRWLQIDFMRKRYVWLAISGVVVLVSAVSLGARGLNLGIDFRGGTQITFKTAQPTQLSTVRSIVGKVTGESSAPIEGTGKTVGGSDSYEGFQIRLRSPSQKIQNNLTQHLESQVGARISGNENVSGSFSSQIAQSAIEAIIVSFLLIMAYISMRFDFKFAAPVIVAVLHDIVITVGVYALTAREVTTSTVAAVLTVLGYSIYDTIIIFDRIRENVPLMRQSTFAHIVNVSVWETIRRSLATTFITLLPVGALFIAGGATLKDFAFALLIGITSGAYSSIFVAAPLLTIWKEREPEYARRMQAGTYQRGARETSVGAVAPQPALAVAEQASSYAKYGSEEAAKRERRRQRRRSRPHGRPR